MIRTYLSGNVSGTDAVALGSLALVLLWICPVVVHCFRIWRQLLMSSYSQTRVNLEDICWDDFRCSVCIRATYKKEPFYPFGRSSQFEGGGVELCDLEVMGAVLLDSQSTTYPASPDQCRAIERQIRCESRDRVKEALELVVAG